MGYRRAGFEVVGVDIKPQPNYPFEFVHADALDFLDSHPIKDIFDVVHASPPCQVFTREAGQKGTRENHVNLIPPVRDRLIEIGLPYIIENVSEAWWQLRKPTELCGLMFNLNVFRHRLFETSFKLPVLPHPKHTAKHIGDGFFQTVTGNAGGSSKRDGTKFGLLSDWKRAMGIDWMLQEELREAIPPAYTEWIGRFLS